MSSHVIVRRKALAEALKRIEPVAENAIGGFVKMTVFGGVLALTSRGGDMSVSANIECSGDDGSITVNQPELAKFINAAKGDDMVLTFEGDVLSITCGTSLVVFLSAADIPVAAVPQFDTFSRDGLIDAIKFAAAGMSKEKVRYNMRGLWFQTHDRGVNIWGVSGPFMLRALVPGLKLSANSTVPYDAVNVIKTFADGLSIDIREREWVATVCKTSVFWGPLLEETFPDVQGVLSSMQEIGQVATITREALLDAIAVAAVGSSDGEKPMVTLEAKKSGLWVTGTERGNAVKTAGQHLIEMPLDAPLKIIIDTANLKKSVSAFPDGPISIMHGKISNGELIRLSTDYREAYLMGVMG